MNILNNFQQNHDKTLVMSLNFLKLAQKYGDRLIGLGEGKIIFDASVKAVSEKMSANLYSLSSPN